MRSYNSVFAMVLLAAGCSAQAGEVPSGVAVGGRIGSYSTVKCAGADDGVKVGQSLCYT